MNESGTSGIQETISDQPKSFNEEDLMRRVESMSYHERINYVRQTLKLG
jgi:hypothetical protein